MRSMPIRPSSRLVGEPSRSRYEDSGSDFLTDAEFALFLAEHDRLSCKVAPESP
jgi:hypothetical protein